MDTSLFLKNLKAFGLQNNIPNISEKNAHYIRGLLQSLKPRHLLEIGSANGYSTINFALEMKKWGGKITSIEFSQLAYEMAGDNFDEVGVSELIDHYFGDARDIIPLLEETYDFVFIDGLKKESLNFLKLIWNKTQAGSTIIIDDVIKFRYKMEDLYTYLENHKIPHKIIQIDEDDGIMIIKK